MEKSKPYRLPIGFVLTAITVVAVGISLLIPALRPARAHRAAISCDSNLRMVEIAKQQWVRDTGAAVGLIADEHAINRYFGGQGEVRLVCPSGGIYSYGVVGTTPSCSCGRRLEK